MFFLSGTSVMNVPGGFNTGFSFFYAATQAGSIVVYAGVNKTGALPAAPAIPVPALGPLGLLLLTLLAGLSGFITLRLSRRT